MEQIVSLEGVKTLPDSNLEQKDNRPDVPGQAVPDFPLDGRSVICAVLDRDTVLISGIGNRFAITLPAILNDNPRETAACTIVTLPVKNQTPGGQAPFVAVLSLTSDEPLKLERITIRNKGHSHAYAIKHGPLEFGVFLKLIGETAPQSEMGVVDLLIDAILSGKCGPNNRPLVAKIVQHAARKDGVVEMIGRFDEGDVYVQGWAKELPSGSNRVFVLDGGLSVAELSCCMFERKEPGGKAYGFAGLLTPSESLSPDAIRSIFYRGRSGWNKVEAYERRTLPIARALPGQIRALLPKLSFSGDVRTKLTRAAQRFDGRETVSELDVPVRIGIDFCSATGKSGVVVSGWLLDPESRVAAVLLRSGNWSYRLDENWTAQDRPDVTEAYEDLSPFLNGPNVRHRHGFIVFAPKEDGVRDAAPYLEVLLEDGQSAYAPVSIGRATPALALRRLVAGMNPAAALASDLIERQFLPLLEDAGSNAPKVVDVVDIGPVSEKCSRAIVIGLGSSLENVRILLPLFALDPFLKGTPLVLSASQGLVRDHLQEIKRLAAFYGLSIRVVTATNVEDQLMALQAGMTVSPSETVVCLHDGVVPSVAGWLEPLISTFHAKGEHCLVAPTILYEDDTVRWAGAWLDQEDDRTRLMQHYVGYPRRTLHGAEPCELVAAMLSCCVLPRSALEAVGGFAHHYLGTDEKSIDAALKLRRSGVKSYWVPHVEMIHPDDGLGSERTWQKLVGQIDQRLFENAWSDVLQGLAEGGK